MFLLISTLLLHLAHATLAFNITDFYVPPLVPMDQHSVDISCGYDAKFTILNWFKGSHEFFRYKPGSSPATKVFPLPGVGYTDVIACGSTKCHLRLNQLTEEASGLYRCDLEYDKAPYKFDTRTRHMQVYRHPRRTPIVIGLAKEFGEGDQIRAMCSAEKDADIRWYINGEEVVEQRGRIAFMMASNIINFKGMSKPTIALQCAETFGDKLIGSNEVLAYWKGKETDHDEDGSDEIAGSRESRDIPCETDVKSNVNRLGDFETIVMLLLVQNLLTIKF